MAPSDLARPWPEGYWLLVEYMDFTPGGREREAFPDGKRLKNTPPMGKI
jgi:hypothetical protein